MNTTTSQELATVQDAELIEVLRSSLYPGASPQSCALVLGYCRAAGLDPMLKPVHLVPMYDKNTGQNRDTIMPGIGLYRIQAARTGQYAGQDAPVFGPNVVMNYAKPVVEWVEGSNGKKFKRETLVDKELSYPEWCSVTIYRIVGGVRCQFVAVEYWIENYATAGRYSDAPNEMWAKRSRGQLAKCAEAQALRKAFPEVGSMPSADELEGRTFEFEGEQEFTPPAKPRRASEAAPVAPALPEPDDSNVLPTMIVIDEAHKVATLPPEPAHEQAAPAQKAVAPAPKQAAAQASTDTGESATQGECMNAIKTATAKRINLGELLNEMELFNLDPATLNGLTKAQFKSIKARLL